MEMYGLSPSDHAEAVERGRYQTALKMRDDPEAKARVENGVGREFSQRRFPEAYIKDLTEMKQ
jgi:hypothetical protein